jgi:alpha-L-fucosidase 2
MPASVRPEGWHNWGYAEREKTARYAEHKSAGAGANAGARATWAKQLTTVEAKRITAANVLAGQDGWNPQRDFKKDATRGVAAANNRAANQKAAASGSIMPPAPCGSRGMMRTDIEYARAGGESLRLDACVPAGAGPFPAAILVHGGGWSGGDKAKGVDPLFAPLARKGIAWFSINYRLAPRNRYPAAIEDIEAAIRWVKAHASEFKVDPQRLALVGESAGGHLVASVAVRANTDATRVAAVVPIYAPVDLVADTERRGGLSASLKALFGREQADDEMTRILKEASPINYVRAGLPPFLLAHGTADMSVLYSQSTQMQSKLRAAGVSVELITVDAGTHGMSRWEEIDPTYKDRIAAWIALQLEAASARK